MSASNSKIDIRLFYSGGKGDGWASRFIRSLEVDQPVELAPHVPPTTTDAGAKSTLSAAAKRLGVHIASRTIDGKTYVMRLQDDPAQA